MNPLSRLKSLLHPLKLPSSVLNHYLSLTSDNAPEAYTLLLTPSPLPRPSPPSNPTRPFSNAGNTCYISSLLTALFASNDTFDALLTPSPLHIPLHECVSHLRSRTGVPISSISRLREHLVSSGWPFPSGQQDPAELFAFLMDFLSAPTIPLHDHLRHKAPAISADNSVHSERLFWLDLPQSSTRPHTTSAHLVDMLDAYFFAETRPGLRRGPRGVDARVIRSLIPGYTPTRQTGEVASRALSRINFGTMTVPLAIKRYNAEGKSMRPVRIPSTIDASKYVEPFANGVCHTLMLRSVVCHLGPSLSSGHYIAYTFDAAVGWRRWNDLEDGFVPARRADVKTGMPVGEWCEELERNAYLILYEMVPGDGEGERVEGKVGLDERFARQEQIVEDERAAKVLSHDRQDGELARMLQHEEG